MLVVKTGMVQEAHIARLFAASDVTVLSGTRDLDAQVPAECKAIISFGLNGGLSEQIRIGEITVARELVDHDGKVYHPDRGWAMRIGSTMPTYVKLVRWYSSGSFNTADTPFQRAQLNIKFQADVIDDETLGVAQFAAKRGIPWQALRSCSDGANDTVPPAARDALNADGSDNLVRVLTSICRDPLQITAMLDIAHKFGRSLGTLTFAAARVGANFQWGN